MKLWEIDARLDEIYERSIDPETGEVDGEVLDEILSLSMERDEKIEQFALWHKNCTAEADAISKEIMTLQKRLKRLNEKTRWIDSILDKALDGQKFETPKVQIGFRRSVAVEFEDYDEFIEANRYTDMVREKIESTPNKEEIKKRLKAGEEVKGAFLVERLNMQVR